MSETLVFPGDDLVAFDHLAVYGAAAIAEAAGHSDVRIRWTDDLSPHPEVTGFDWQSLAVAVRAHASVHADPASWVAADGNTGDGISGLFSPRIKSMPQKRLEQWYSDRALALDAVEGPWAPLDFAMIGALGAPSYWSFDRGEARPDHGASRWEMKTRNRGEDFIRNRLRLLAVSVASRSEAAVEAGLRGESIEDEVGRDATDSRTPTGLMAPARTDNARAWCALWGISLFSVYPRPSGASYTVGHIGHHSGGYFYLPSMARPWPLHRLRTILRSAQLHIVAAQGVDDLPEADTTSAGTSSAWTWLLDRGVGSVVRFGVHRSDNRSAPEKWAERGERLVPRR